MRLQGRSPDGKPALSYVGTPTGSIVGSAPNPVATIVIGAPKSSNIRVGSTAPRGQIQVLQTV